MRVSVELPIKVISEANQSWYEHRRAKGRRVTSQRGAVKIGLYNHRFVLPGHEKYVVTLTRIAPRNLDGDNLQRSFKAIRDQVAEEIGIDDGSARITWVYGQAKGKPKQYAVRVEVEA